MKFSVNPPRHQPDWPERPQTIGRPGLAMVAVAAYVLFTALYIIYLVAGGA